MSEAAKSWRHVEGVSPRGALERLINPPPDVRIQRTITRYLPMEVKKNSQLSTNDIDRFVEKIPVLMEQDLEAEVAAYLLKGNLKERKALASLRIKAADRLLELDGEIEAAEKTLKDEKNVVAKTKETRAEKKAKITGYGRKLLDAKTEQSDLLRDRDMKKIYEMVKKQQAAITIFKGETKGITEYVESLVAKRTGNVVDGVREVNVAPVSVNSRIDNAPAEEDKEAILNGKLSDVFIDVMYGTDGPEEISTKLRSQLDAFDKEEGSVGGFVAAIINAALEDPYFDDYSELILEDPLFLQLQRKIINKVEEALMNDAKTVDIAKAFPGYLETLERVERNDDLRAFLRVWRDRIGSVTEAL